jgi:hypothetical protein
VELLYNPRNLQLHSAYCTCRFDSTALWFLKLHHIEAKEHAIYNVNILGGSSNMLEVLETNGYTMYLLAEISECLHTKTQLRKSGVFSC